MILLSECRPLLHYTVNSLVTFLLRFLLLLPKSVFQCELCGVGYLIVFFVFCIFLVLFDGAKYLRTRQLLIDFEDGRPVPRLREPQDLFTIPSTSSPFQGVRWPVECAVICDKIYHIGIFLSLVH